MNIELDLQIVSNAKFIPTLAQFKQWVQAVLAEHITDNIELTIRIVDEEESRLLNNKYRHINKPTNVLSFPAKIKPEFNYPLLGDIIICAPIVEHQAKQYHKDLLAHWAHIVIHGVLHLLDYNHTNNKDALIMEGIETDILVRFGYAPPYGEQ